MGTILLVDDNEDTCKIMSLVIARAGHRCLCANSVAEAEEKLADETPDVLMVDLMMPYESGLDLIRSVRNNSAMKEIPIIVYSAVSEQSYIDEAMDLGATDYWLKGSVHGHDFARKLQPYLPNGTGWADPWPPHHMQA